MQKMQLILQQVFKRYKEMKTEQPIIQQQESNIDRQNIQSMHCNVTLIDLKLSSLTIPDTYRNSPYQITKQGKWLDVYDDQIRKVEESFAKESILSEASEPIIRQYLSSSNYNFALIQHDWRVLKYSEGGHCLRHSDFPKCKKGYIHVANEIFIPPTSLCNFEGGVLVIQDSPKALQIAPDEGLWTHVILPMGLYHTVTNVKVGTRFSFLKEIFIEQNTRYKNPNIDTEKPCFKHN